MREFGGRPLEDWQRGCAASLVGPLLQFVTPVLFHSGRAPEAGLTVTFAGSVMLQPDRPSAPAILPFGTIQYDKTRRRARLVDASEGAICDNQGLPLEFGCEKYRGATRVLARVGAQSGFPKIDLRPLMHDYCGATSGRDA
jgi:hypothetical protein